MMPGFQKILPAVRRLNETFLHPISILLIFVEVNSKKLGLAVKQTNMKIPGIIACALIAIASSHGEVVMGQKNMVAKKSKPNVILIYTDDQGSLDLNIYGAKELQTPNIDRLARNGVRFTSFYSASPVCSPSRASLLTGRYPQRAGLADNAPSAYGSGGMPGAQFTMAEMFKQGGYKTGEAE